MFMNIFKKIKKNQSGVSLLELVVAVSMFTFVMLAATDIFQTVIQGQRASISAQNVQENMRYAFEAMSKEIRTAKQDEENKCSFGGAIVYNVLAGGKELAFLNQDGQCVRYFLENNRIKIGRSPEADFSADEIVFVTPDDILVDDLMFIAEETSQPKVTFTTEVRAIAKEINEEKIRLQTTISSRYYYEL